MPKARISSEEVTERVVTETQPRLLTVKEASEKYNKDIDLIHRWIQRGKLRVINTRKNPGTRPVLLISEQELEKLVFKTLDK